MLPDKSGYLKRHAASEEQPIRLRQYALSGTCPLGRHGAGAASDSCEHPTRAAASASPAKNTLARVSGREESPSDSAVHRWSDREHRRYSMSQPLTTGPAGQSKDSCERSASPPPRPLSSIAGGGSATGTGSPSKRACGARSSPRLRHATSHRTCPMAARRSAGRVRQLHRSRRMATEAMRRPR